MDLRERIAGPVEEGNPVAEAIHRFKSCDYIF